MRRIRADDLELYAINTGELYQAHKLLAKHGTDRWIKHLRTKVLPRYCKEIEPVFAEDVDVEAAAVALRNYYRQHMEESGGA